MKIRKQQNTKNLVLMTMIALFAIRGKGKKKTKQSKI